MNTDTELQDWNTAIETAQKNIIKEINHSGLIFNGVILDLVKAQGLKTKTDLRAVIDGLPFYIASENKTDLYKLWEAW